MDGVAEFVQQDIVDEARGEGHEIKTEVDGVTSRTAAPAGLRRLDAHTFVLESVFLGQGFEAWKQDGFSLNA